MDELAPLFRNSIKNETHPIIMKVQLVHDSLKVQHRYHMVPP